jgi:hypothetical protein
MCRRFRNNGSPRMMNLTAFGIGAIKRPTGSLPQNSIETTVIVEDEMTTGSRMR